MSAQNLTLLTDLYELTMMQGYFETQENQTVIFDVFFRENPNKGGYSIMAGVDQVIDYIKNLNFSYEDVDYLSPILLSNPIEIPNEEYEEKAKDWGTRGDKGFGAHDNK